MPEAVCGMTALLVNPNSKVLSLIQEVTTAVFYYYPSCPHLWEGNIPSIHCCENDGPLVYRWLCFQIGDEQQEQ